jgi:hypothetical protein
MTPTFSDRQFRGALHAKISQQYENNAAALVDGLASDAVDYKGRVEYLRALRDVLSWSEDIQAEMNAEPKRG